jgi:hypothetical protein
VSGVVAMVVQVLRLILLALGLFMLAEVEVLRVTPELLVMVELAEAEMVV